MAGIGRGDQTFHTHRGLHVTTAIVIDITGVCRVEQIPHPDLNRLQELVGGYIEGVALPRLGHGHFAYINEDGKALGLIHNEVATALCQRAGTGLAEGDYISGVMVVVGRPDKDGNDTSVSMGEFVAALSALPGDHKVEGV